MNKLVFVLIGCITLSLFSFACAYQDQDHQNVIITDSGGVVGAEWGDRLLTQYERNEIYSKQQNLIKLNEEVNK